MTRLPSLLACGAVVCIAITARADVNSGPKAGDPAEGFRVYAATGDDAGKTLDLVAERKDKPTVFVFIQADQWDRPMARFVKVLDQEIAGGIDGAPDAATVAVWLADDQEKSRQYLPTAQQSLQMNRTTLAVFEGDSSGPPSWSIAPGARLTAVVVRGGKVVKSVGFNSLNETDVPAVVRALKGS
jgi:hypothetical protein